MDDPFKPVSIFKEEPFLRWFEYPDNPVAVAEVPGHPEIVALAADRWFQVCSYREAGPSKRENMEAAERLVIEVLIDFTNAAKE